MNKIRSIELVPLAFRLPQAYGSARGLAAQRQATIVKLTTDDGVLGIGEAWGPCNVTQAFSELFAPLYIGADLYDCEQIAARILASHYHFGTHLMMAFLSGVDVAALDAIGRLQGVPAYKLLGGLNRKSIPIYASGGYFTEDPDASFPAMLEALDALKTHSKIKIGRSPSWDVKRVRDARAALGEQHLLLVDVNGNYSVDAALESMRRTADYNVHWYEEPLPPQDYNGYAQLRARANVAIATGEALYTSFEFKRLLDLNGVDVLQPDISLCGGLRTAREVALLARLSNARISPHVWGAGVGLAAACHFIASLPSFPHHAHTPYPPLLEYDVGHNALRDDILTAPLRPVNGTIELSDLPGLGVALNEDALRFYAAQ